MAERTAVRAAPEITVREYRPGDEHAILEGFNRAFGAIDPNFESRSLDAWRWRYLENPAGWRIWLALLEDGTVVAQQCGMPVRVHMDERRVKWEQVCDTFVDPHYARALRKPGLFYRVAKPYSDNYGGAPPDRDPILYGMPTRRAHRIGGSQLGYAEIRAQNKLVLDVHSLAPAQGGGWQLDEVDRIPEDVDELFESVAADRAAMLVRDVDYLTWRYIDNPEHDYRVAIVRRESDGALGGLAAFSSGVFDSASSGLVCDWLCRPDDKGAAELMLEWLVECTRNSGESLLTAVQSECSKEFEQFQASGFRVAPSAYYLVGRCYDGPYPMEWIHDHWDYQLGDFDLC